MRRALPAALMSAAGLGLVLTFKTTPVSGSTRVATQATPTTTPAAGAPPASTGATAPIGTLPPTGAAPGATAAPTGSASPSSAAPAATGGSRTIQGEVIPTRFGNIQVAVVLQGDKIVDVQQLQAPNDRRRSVMINNAAWPILKEEVLQAQSANIDSLSGATVTSDAYAQSLQSALDKARAGA
jgi:uncharacterized protein with FMN-binding domain